MRFAASCSRRNALAALLALAPIAALGHGAAPQKASESVEIAAAPASVWAVVGDFQDASWLPGVQKFEGAGGAIPEAATRRLTFAAGVIEERLVQYDAEARMLRYILSRGDFAVLPVGNLSATLRVSPTPAGAIVEWRARFYRAFPGGDPPEQYTDEIAVKAVTTYFKAGLAALKAKVEGR